MNDSVAVEIFGKRAVPVFADTKFEVSYIMKHRKNGFENKYAVICEIRGIADCNPHLSVESAKFIGDSNQETLVEQAAIELFENFIE